MGALIGILLSLPFVIMTALAIRAFSKQNEPHNSRRLSIGESLTAWFLGMIFVCGGFSKLMPFPGVMGPIWLEERLAPYDLATFARFIAWSEAAIGLLLLFRKTFCSSLPLYCPAAWWPVDI